MKNLKLLRVVIILIAAGLLVFLIFYTRTVAYTINDYSQKTRVQIYSRLSLVGNIISRFKTAGILTRDIIGLEKENQSLISRLAYQEELEEENNFLRKALGLPTILKQNLSEAGGFNFQFTPTGSHLLVNKGVNDDIKKGDIVISSSGILVGVIDEVFSGYSRVATITDVNFKATIKLLSKKISGIANGIGEGGINIDFISQNDEVLEGDIIVTSGSDIFPPGLIIGNVIRVSSSGGSLFKEVMVKPSFEKIDLSQVLIIIK